MTTLNDYLRDTYEELLEEEKINEDTSYEQWSMGISRRDLADYFADYYDGLSYVEQSRIAELLLDS